MRNDVRRWLKVNILLIFWRKFSFLNSSLYRFELMGHSQWKICKHITNYKRTETHTWRHSNSSIDIHKQNTRVIKYTRAWRHIYIYANGNISVRIFACKCIRTHLKQKWMWCSKSTEIIAIQHTHTHMHTSTMADTNTHIHSYIKRWDFFHLSFNIYFYKLF